MEQGEVARPVRVDLIGTQGIGKTSLCRAVLRTFTDDPEDWPGRLPWRSIPFALRVAEKNAFKTRGVRKAPLHVRAMRFLGIVRDGLTYQVLCGRTIPERVYELEKWKYQRAFELMAENSSYLGHYLEHLLRQADGICPFTADQIYRRLVSDLGNWALLSRWASPIAFLADWYMNFSAQPAYWVGDGNVNSSARGIEAATAYCRSSLAPAGIVYLDTVCPELVLQRVRERQHLRGEMDENHRGLSDREVLRYAVNDLASRAAGVEFLRSQGVPVLTLDGSVPLQENAMLVRDFLERVAGEAAKDVAPPLGTGTKRVAVE